MTKKQLNMPTIKRDELYAALYTDLISIPCEKQRNEMRINTLKTLLGVDEKGLIRLIERYNKEKDASQIIETKKEVKKSTNTTINEFGDIVKYWRAIHDLYVCYLEALTTKQEENPTHINKILIYEAPPMPYATENKKYPNRKGKINYILAQSYQNCKKSEDCTDKFPISPSGPYVDTIKGLVKDSTTRTIQDILIEQGILFIDLCPLPLPMTSKNRKEIWGKRRKWDGTMKNKPLSLVLLELALKFAIDNGIQISKKPIIAMGTPTATSQSIYYYFVKTSPELKIKNKDDIEVVIHFSNLLETNNQYEKNGQILPLYESNIIAGSNTPNAELLKRIFLNKP